jgi:hypothetical protein
LRLGNIELNVPSLTIAEKPLALGGSGELGGGELGGGELGGGELGGGELGGGELGGGELGGGGGLLGAVPPEHAPTSVHASCQFEPVPGVYAPPRPHQPVNGYGLHAYTEPPLCTCAPAA